MWSIYGKSRALPDPHIDTRRSPGRNRAFPTVCAGRYVGRLTSPPGGPYLSITFTSRGRRVYPFQHAVRRLLSGAVAFSLAATAAAVVVTAGPASRGAAAPPIDERAAESTALRLAAESGRTVEVAGSKSELARTVATPRGTLVRQSYAVPRWTKGKDGGWRDIDLTLRKDGATVAPAASAADVRFSAGGTEPLVTLNGAGGALRLTWPAKLPAPRIEGDAAVYESVLPDVDLQVQSTVEGFGYSLVVKTRQAAANPALAKLTFGLSTTGWSLRQRPGGGYETRDKTDKITASAGPALMWDSAGAPAAHRSLAAGKNSVLRHIPDESRKASLPTTVESGSLVIVPDATMLADPNIAFPVVIDPWTTVGKARWGYADSTNANRDDGIVRVGQNPDGSGTYRSFFAFDLTWLPGKQIRGAKFITTMTHSWSCGPTPVNLYRTGDLTGSGRQGWSGPGLSLHVEQRSGNAHKPSTGDGCTGDPQPNMYMEFANQTLLNDVINFGQGRGSYTLGLSARDSDGTDETTTNRWKKFDQGSTALSIEYNNLPNTPATSAMTTHTDYTAAGFACVTGTGRPLVRSTTPWLKANISDPDGNNSGQLSAAFALQQWNGTAWAAVAGWPKGDSGVPSGTLAEVQIPAGTLSSTSYRWQAQVSDGLGGTSNWSSWCEFSIDTTPPGILPTVTADDGLYLESPPNDTMRGSVGRSGQFRFGANGVADVTEYEYQLDGGAKTYVSAATAGGTATVWVTPTHVGEHVLTVRSRDAAQNASPPKDYRFLVNSPSAPKAVWGLDEGTGTTLATAPAGGPGSTLTNGPTWVDGRVLGTHAAAGQDRAVKFDGTDDWAATAGPVLDTSKSFSAAVWTRFTGSPGTWRSVLCQEGSHACGFTISFMPAPTDRWILDMYSGDVNNPTIDRIVSPAAPAVGQWTHLAMSWDAGTRTAKLYVDGVLAGSVTHTTNWNAGGPLLFGRARYNGAANNPFLGEIAEVRVWDRVVDLTVDIKPLVAPVLAGAWEMEDFDESAPREAADDSGYQRPLTLGDPASTFWCDGYNLSGGLCFDGVSGVASTGVVLRTDQSVTATAWAKLDTLTSVDQIVVNQGPFHLFFRGWDHKWGLTIRTPNGSGGYINIEANSPSVATTGQWVHLAAVFDATTGNARLYVAGVLVKTSTGAIGEPSTAGLPVGNRPNPRPFGGGIDRVRVWQGILSNSQITALSQET
jgi:hypothetical protein